MGRAGHAQPAPADRPGARPGPGAVTGAGRRGGDDLTEPTADETRPRRLTEKEKVVRAFIRDGRLVSIPAKPSKRELLLPVILDRCFPEDRPYDESEVNLRLARLHPDVAALRRYLVDGGLMTREAGVYRRTRPLELEGTSARGGTGGPVRQEQNEGRR